MEYVNLGRSGLKVSRICLGTMSYGDPTWREWVLSEEDSRPHIQRALELGINFFDTANSYSVGVSEEVVGRALKDFARREEVVIATKVYFHTSEKPNQGGLSRVHIMKAIDDSLRRLGTDYVDLYQIHRWDYETPIEETLEALHDVVKAGKARYLGASSMYAWQFAKALQIAERRGLTRFISMQNHYNLVYREEEREMMPLCLDEGIAVIPWSPLARGFLAGNRTRADKGGTIRASHDPFADQMYFQEADFQVLDRVLALAEARRLPPAQIAMAWLLHQPGVAAPIVGTTKIEQLEQAVQSLEIKLDEHELRSLEELYVPHPVLGHS
jgi:1-deoxyxylulose-5-phosphate synthase